MASIPNNQPLCPVTAWRLWRLSAPKAFPGPLFSYTTGRSTKWVTHSSLVMRLRDLLTQAGYDPQKYSGHSLRRGGAEFSARIGLSHLVIQLRGDWKSQAYLRYVSLHDNVNMNAARALSLAASNLHEHS